MKTCCSLPSKWASESSECLFIWQRTWSAKTYCLNPSFLCCYRIIILISYPNWIKQKQNLTQFLSSSSPLKERYSKRVAVQLFEVCSLVKSGGLFSFLFALFRLHFFSTCWMKHTHAASGLRKDGVPCTPDFICAAVCCLTCVVVCRRVDLRHNGKKKQHRTIHSLAAGFLLKNCSEWARILKYFVFVRRIERVLVFEAFGISNVKEEQCRQIPMENWLNSLVGHNFIKLIWLSAFHYAFITISNCFSLQYFILLPAVLLLLFIFEF